MREFKFRAWHKEVKCILHGEAHHIFIWREEGQPVEIMECTGMSDKNSCQIFEGDIVSKPKPLSSKPIIGIVYMGDFCVHRDDYGIGYFAIGWHVRCINERGIITHYALDETFEVIGNIHQNHELLNP